MPGWRDDERGDGPSRAELAREEHEDLMRDTYEVRYQDFCRRNLLDPQDGESVLIYEHEWEDDEVERGRYVPGGDAPPD